MSRSLPETRPLVSRHATRVMGGASSVHAFYDATEDHVVAVVTAEGAPSPSLTTVSTSSVHAVSNLLDGDDIRVELLLVTESRYEEAANIVAAAAFCVLKDGWLAAPGVVFPGAVAEYYPDSTTPHLMWTEPFDFPTLSTAHVEGVGHDVHWLQGVPLTEREREFLLESGFDALTTRLEAADAPYFDIARVSVV